MALWHHNWYTRGWYLSMCSDVMVEVEQVQWREKRVRCMRLRRQVIPTVIHWEVVIVISWQGNITRTGGARFRDACCARFISLDGECGGHPVGVGIGGRAWETMLSSSNCVISKTDYMMTKGLRLGGWCSGQLCTWVSWVPAGHGTCPMVQIPSSTLSTRIFQWVVHTRKLACMSPTLPDLFISPQYRLGDTHIV